MTRRGEKNLSVVRKSRPPKGRGGRQVRAVAGARARKNGASPGGRAVVGPGPTSTAGKVNGHAHPSPDQRLTRRKGNPSSAAAPQNGSAKSGANIQGASGRPPKEPAVLRPGMSERQVIERCLQGDATAWSIIYQRFHDPLVSSVRAFLGKAGNDRDLVEEICARVWYALVRNNFELLARFDVERGVQLTTFLALLAKTQARLLLRSERRRRAREQVASRPEAHPPEAISWNVLADHDFLTTLSPAERAFLRNVLVADVVQQAQPPAQGGEHYSRQYAWQLRHRVRRKLEFFLR